MFDIAFSEIIVVCIVSLIVLGPTQSIALLKEFFNIIDIIKSWYVDFTERVKADLDEEDLVNIIYDEEGKPYKAYNIESIKPYLKENRDE